MNLAGTTFPVRLIGAVTFSVLVIGTGVGTALADPPSRAGDYFAQVAPGTRPDDRAGIRGPNAPSFTTASVTSPVVRPDDRAGVRGVGVAAIASTGLVAAAGSGFDWVDAGIGATSTLALILLGGGVFLIGTRRHGHARGKPTAPALHG